MEAIKQKTKKRMKVWSFDIHFHLIMIAMLFKGHPLFHCQQECGLQLRTYQQGWTIHWQCKSHAKISTSNIEDKQQTTHVFQVHYLSERTDNLTFGLTKRLELALGFNMYLPGRPYTSENYQVIVNILLIMVWNRIRVICLTQIDQHVCLKDNQQVMKNWQCCKFW